MSIVAFKLKGDYAHFSHPATIYSSITYPIPPKTAIMGLVGAIIGKEDYVALRDMKYSVKIDRKFSKKSFVFNGIKNALSSNMKLKEGYQNSSEKKQFYRELICKPSYTIFLDLKSLHVEIKKKIIEHLKEHKSVFTPYLGINFCIANFEWIEIEKCKKIEAKECKVSTSLLQKDFIFDALSHKIKLTTARMACDCEEGRVFKDFRDFIVELNGGNFLKAKNSGNIYQIDQDCVYFV